MRVQCSLTDSKGSLSPPKRSRWLRPEPERRPNHGIDHVANRLHLRHCETIVGMLKAKLGFVELRQPCGPPGVGLLSSSDWSACQNGIVHNNGQPRVSVRVQYKFISHLRVSTDRQGKSGLGLEAQRQAEADFLKGREGRLLGEHVEVESGRNNDRPKLATALANCRMTGATLVVAKIDRLARNVRFLLTVVEGSGDGGVMFCDLPALPVYDGSSLVEGHGFQAHVGPMRSKSRGWVRLTREIFAQPVVIYALATPTTSWIARPWLASCRSGECRGSQTDDWSGQPSHQNYKLSQMSDGTVVLAD
jgi:hypothetical protein